MDDIHYKPTKYGFEYGSAKVTRITHDEKRAYVIIGLETPKHSHFQIYVTKTGKIRVFSKDGEWGPIKNAG